MLTRFRESVASTRGPSVARLLVLVGLLLGLFAMHALGHCGTAGHKDGPGSGSSSASTDVGAAHAGEFPVHSSHGRTVTTEHDGQAGGGVAMVGLCMAVLAGALLGLLALLRPTRAVLFLRPRALLVSALPVRATRDRDPPCLFELSVLRT